ncbi:MAG: hypothetical protein JXK04_03020 [Campylobacterales bacterium]|nr:hypothetical protein [Campylobacterales bacterium]
MAKINKRMVARIALYGVAGLAAIFIYARGNVPVETDAEYCERTGRVKIQDRFFKYDVYENGEMKTIADMLSRGCNEDAYCEIDRAYQYVLKIPYQESSTNRNPSEVINQQGGDCDEKSYLLATLLLQQGHRCVFVTTADHGFIAVHLENGDALQSPSSYLTVDGKKYYFAEATFTTGYIGQPNDVARNEIEAVFDMVGKKEIPIDTVRFTLAKR